MTRQTFVLTQKKWFRRTVKLFLKTDNNKIDQRSITFTTEHKISEKERMRNAKLIAAEFSTADEKIIEGLYHDTGYGITFVHKDDPEGKRKKKAFKVTPLDAKKIALSNLFEDIDLEFDGSKSLEVLTEEYNFYMSAKRGVVLKESTAKKIEHEKIDIVQQMKDTANEARAIYEKRYGEPVPDKYKDDLKFLSALSNPQWDAKAYMEEAEAEEEAEEFPDDAEELRKLYFSRFGEKVANPKKNDIEWIKSKLRNG